MLIEEKKVIFLHIPKTGGSSIEHAFMGIEPVKLRHFNLESILCNALCEKASYFIFTIVRNPFERIVSSFRHMTRMRESIERATGHPVAKIDFCDYVRHARAYLLGDPAQYELKKSTYVLSHGKIVMDLRHIERLDYWVKPEDLDCLLRFESLAKDFKAIRKKYKLSKLPHVNQSKTIDYRAFYDQETREMTQEMYREDLDRLGYGF